MTYILEQNPLIQIYRNSLYEQINFSINGTNIESTSIHLNKYKNFDILIENISANNYTSVILYVYISKDNITYIKTQYSLTINYGDTTGCILNCISNTPYIKLMGTYVSGLTLNNAIVYMKG
jgi:hypothetical protein